jgi:hypothetical protein
MATKKREPGELSCSVVDSFCLAPNDGVARGICFACGDRVCANCSLVVAYLTFGAKRICHTCMETHKLPNADSLIHTQAHRLAGYPCSPNCRP